MIIYIILILAIIIAVLFIFKKKNIQETFDTLKTMKQYGGSMQKMPKGQSKLGECEADCDRDSDCKPGLKCFQRNGRKPPPGCKSGGRGDIYGWDYCYNPNFYSDQFKQYELPVNATESSGIIQIIGNDPIKPEKGKLVSIKDSNGNDFVFTRDYTLKFDIKANDQLAEDKRGNIWRSVIQRTFNKDSKKTQDYLPGVFFRKSRSDKGSRVLTIYLHTTKKYSFNTPPLPKNKWTTVSIQLKDDKFTIKLSGSVNHERTYNVKSIGSDATKQYYYQNNRPTYLYLGNPHYSAANSLVKNMTWENHRDKKCFARMPSGCEKPLGELSKLDHSNYKTIDTGWIEGGWNWDGTDDGCNITRKKALNDYCMKNDAMMIVQDKRPEKDVFGGWIGLPNNDSESNIIKMSDYPQCKTECTNNPECNNIRWTLSDKKCTLLRSAPETKTDSGWGFMKLWKTNNVEGMTLKNPNNVTEHNIPTNKLSWEEAVKSCQGKKQNLANKQEILGFVQTKDDAVSWTPVKDGNNFWLQLGSKMSKKNANDANPSVADYGLLYQNTLDVSRQGANKMPTWGQTSTPWPWKKKYYCSGTYEETEETKTIGTCPDNCAKPTKVTGNCESGNPIETTVDGVKKYYKKCKYGCLGPTDDGYKDLEPKSGKKYTLDSTGNIDTNIHGCRTSTQCGGCGTHLVEVKGKFVEENKDGIIKKIFVEDTDSSSSSTSSSSSSESQYTCNASFDKKPGKPCDSGKCLDNDEKCSSNEVCKSGCCNDFLCVGVPEGAYKEDDSRKGFNDANKRLNELAAKYGSSTKDYMDVSGSDTEDSINSNQQNVSDTTYGNMFTDITNANDIGQLDKSLEDYYKRRILNNSTENRLGGSNSANNYIKKMPADNNGKVSFFNSVWTLFN